MPLTMEMPETLESEEFNSIEELESTPADDADDDAERHPDDPKCNSHGVFTEGVETIEIKFRKKSNAAGNIRVVHGSCGKWWSAYGWSAITVKEDQRDIGGGHAPALKNPSFDTRKTAVVDALEQLKSRAKEAKNKPMLEDVTKFLGTVEMWPDERPAIDPLANNQTAENDLPPPAAAPVHTPTPIEDYEARLDDATKRVARTALYQAKCDAEAKQAKAGAKLALEELQAIVNRGPETYPLFDGPTTTATSTAQPHVAEATTDAPAGDPDDDESWRDVEVGELKIPTGIVDKLIEAELETVGKLANWTASWKLLTDIGGIGQAKAEKIEQALVEFWAGRKAGA